MNYLRVSSHLRAAARVALDCPRVVGLVLAVVVAETALRLALGVTEPLAIVLCPPIVAVPLLGAAAPAIRAVVCDPEVAPDWHLAAHLRAVGPRLFVAAVLGHIVAVALGAALFILIDTPVRFAVYALGGSVPSVIVVFTPLVGVVLVGEVVVTIASVVSLVYTIGIPLVVFLLVVGGLFLLASVFVAPFCYAAVVALVDCTTTGVTGTDDGLSSSPRIPVRRAVAACVIVLALVAGASAVWVTETRPMPNATTPLPSDPTAAYATAVSNTVASNNRIEYHLSNGNGNPSDTTRVLDRTDRRFRTSYRTKNENNTRYADAGVGYLGDHSFALGTRRIGRHTVWVKPGYWTICRNYNPTGSFGIPKPNTGTWKVISRGNGTETLELDGPASFRACDSSARIPSVCALSRHTGRQIASSLLSFASSPARSAGFQRNLRSRSAHASFVPQKSAPSGIRTLVLAVRGQDDWPDYTNGACVLNRNRTDCLTVAFRKRRGAV